MKTEKQFRGTIHNWRFQTTGDKFIVTGVITPEDNDERQHQGFFPGRATPIYTSYVVKINDDETQVETRNSIYNLGEKYGGNLSN